MNVVNDARISCGLLSVGSKHTSRNTAEIACYHGDDYEMRWLALDRFGGTVSMCEYVSHSMCV